MIASAVPSHSLAAVQSDFLAATPRLVRHARCYFRHVRCRHKKADCISEVVSLCWKWWLRLVELGKDPSKFVSVLATFAARAVRSGRRLCGQLKAKDAMSERAQQRHDFRVEPLPTSTRRCHENIYAARGQQDMDAFEERLQDNTMTPPPDQAAFRIDFPAWLKTRTDRDRRIIKKMSMGERTQDLSRKFGISPARVSQLRRQFHDDWEQFTNDEPVVAVAS